VAVNLTDLESDILRWLLEATHSRANIRMLASNYLDANPDIEASRLASAVDALEAFVLVATRRSWGGHVYQLALTQKALILGREDQTSITIHNTAHNTMINSPGGQQTTRQDASAKGQVTDESEETRTPPGRDTGTGATTAHG